MPQNLADDKTVVWHLESIQKVIAISNNMRKQTEHQEKSWRFYTPQYIHGELIKVLSGNLSCVGYVRGTVFHVADTIK